MAFLFLSLLHMTCPDRLQITGPQQQYYIFFSPHHQHICWCAKLRDCQFIQQYIEIFSKKIISKSWTCYTHWMAGVCPCLNVIPGWARKCQNVSREKDFQIHGSQSVALFSLYSLSSWITALIPLWFFHFCYFLFFNTSRSTADMLKALCFLLYLSNMTTNISHWDKVKSTPTVSPSVVQGLEMLQALLHTMGSSCGSPKDEL